MFSIRFRTRLWEITLAAIVVFFAWFLQADLLTRLSLGGLLCNLPLTLTIIWASIFGSYLPTLTASDLRTRPMIEILICQALSGSISGAAVGALFAALYASVLPIYPVSYPLIGWISGYFPLRKVNHAEFFSIPLVLLASVIAEFFMACQLSAIGRPQVMPHFVHAALPEAALNAIIAPLIFFPLQRWYEFRQAKTVTEIQ